MMRRFVQLAAIGLFAASGCSSGSYDEDYRKSVQSYRKDAELLPTPDELAGKRLSLRLPRAFTEQDIVGDKKWSKPPFLKDFPGFAKAVSELTKEIGNAQPPAVFSVGALTDKDSNLEDIKNKILNQVQKEASFAKATWATVEVDPIAGGKVPWSVLKLAGPQPFDRVNNKVPESKNTDGETQIWVASDTDTKVSTVLVWRVAQEREADVQLEKLAGLVASTVEFKGPKERDDAPEPDPPAEK
jgi:hypothetical protein